jgi:apolipoprotein N-acyltransferase
VTRIAPWLLAAGSGLAFALALPGAGWTPLILLFPGLLLEALDRTPSGRRAWLLGWVAGAVHWVVAVNWVLPVMHHYGGLPLAAALGCLVGMAAILGSCWAAAVAVTGVLPGRLRVWILPPAFVAFDGLRRFWPFEFPWHPPAVALASLPSALGSLPIWGSSGLGWATIALGAGLWAVLRQRTRRTGTAAIIAALAATAALSVAAPEFEAGSEPLTVGVIQPGTSLEQKWDPDNWQEMESAVWRLARDAADRGAAIVLWPESALPYRIDTDPEYRERVTRTAEELGIMIVLNSVAGSAAVGFTNSAFAVGPEGVRGRRYDKVKLVPFGEYVPSWARLAFTDSLVREVGAFTPGREPVLLDAGVQLGMAICYEVVFAELLAAATRSGAELLVTLTNDGWYGYSWAPKQHFAHVVLRAAENRRWFARAALTGISGFVAPDGSVSSVLEVGDHGVLVAELWPSRRLTPRARLGDWWAVVCWLATAVLAVIGVRKPAMEELKTESSKSGRSGKT